MKYRKNPTNLDKFDIKIISALQLDGRITKLQLAEKIGLSATPCWERMKKLEKAGIIKGYHAELDICKLIDVFYTRIEITLKKYSLALAAEFEKLLCYLPEVIECEAMLGDVDYTIKVLSRNMEEYQQFIEKILKDDRFEIDFKSFPVSKIIKQSNHLNVEKIYNHYYP